MTLIFLDTSFLLALLRKKDEFHARALAWQRAIDCPLLTTEYVLVELGDACAHPQPRSSFAATVEWLQNDPGIALVAASPALLDEGLELFRDSRDKRWGITDCISFRVMRDRAVHDALTADHHFEQAGFRALLRHDPSELTT